MPFAPQTLKIIAHIENDFVEKFGIPRQSGLVKETMAKVVFEPEFRNKEAVRGLEQYSHIWLIWAFSENKHTEWSPTVRPPRLGGNTRVGVFATRSPYRPNALGLSCVKLERIEQEGCQAPTLFISGADLMSGTPIYDIKPYLPYVDSHPEALGGFSEIHKNDKLQVSFPEQLIQLIPSEKQASLIEALANDPRPAYQNDPERIYGLRYAQFNLKFSVKESTLTVLSVETSQSNQYE